jgi:hypothetical protein
METDIFSEELLYFEADESQGDFPAPERDIL